VAVSSDGHKNSRRVVAKWHHINVSPSPSESQPPDSAPQADSFAAAVIIFIFNYYWVFAIILFFTASAFTPLDQVRVVRYFLQVPFLEDNMFLLRLIAVLTSFLAGTAAAFLCYRALLHLKKPVSFRPFWAALIFILGFVAFVRPYLIKQDLAWVAPALTMILMLLALWRIYKLDWILAFSIWILGYMMLVSPTFITDDNPIAARTRSMPQTSVLAEIKSLHSSMISTEEKIEARHRLMVDFNRILSEAEKGNAEAQYDVGLLDIEGGAANEPSQQTLEDAFQWLTKSSNQGFVDAQDVLGDFYRDGIGIPLAPAEAARLYRSASDKGNLDSEAKLGSLYARGFGLEWNGEEAVRHFKNAIQGGSALGLWGLGDLYLSGNGVERNHELGMSYLVQAAEKGCEPAMAQLGVLLLAGDNPTSVSQAVAYLHQAAKARVAEAQYLTMMLYTEGLGVIPLPPRSRWWGHQLSTMADTGVAEAQAYWGLALENGLTKPADPAQAWTSISQAAYKGLPWALNLQGDYLAYGLAGSKDLAKAIISYQTAAQFDAGAMQKLILRYQNGIDVPHDRERMDYYLAQLRVLASHGNPQAAEALGDFYRNGIVQPQNNPLAISFYRQAADYGRASAYYRLGEMAENGEGGPKDARAAFHYYRQAATLLYLPAFYNVAVALAAGTGVAKNGPEAQEWFRRIQRGAERGNMAHQLSLARLRDRGLFVARDEAAAAAVYQIAALRNDDMAERALATLYIEGRGVHKDYVQAYEWLQRAARFGDGRAKHMAEALWKKMPPAQRAQAKKVS